MTLTTSIRTLSGAALAAFALTSSALASGEPKNELPFTRAIGVERAATVVAGVKHLSLPSSHATTGEAKSTLPFTRR
jgi:hypothetical protein